MDIEQFLKLDAQKTKLKRMKSNIDYSISNSIEVTILIDNKIEEINKQIRRTIK